MNPAGNIKSRGRSYEIGVCAGRGGRGGFEFLHRRKRINGQTSRHGGEELGLCRQNLVWVPGSATYHLCDLGQVTKLMSLFPRCCNEIIVMIKWINNCKVFRIVPGT